MKELTKGQRCIVVITVLWGLLSYSFVHEVRASIGLFLICMSPFILYWSGVWIFGFGYLLKCLKWPFKKLKIKTISINKLKSLYFSFDGKINRLTYFMASTFLAITDRITMLLENWVILILLGLLLIYMQTALIKKRSRDFNNNGILFIMLFIAFLITSFTKEFLIAIGNPNEFMEIVYAINALLLGAANLCLLFNKGKSDDDITKKSNISKTKK